MDKKKYTCPEMQTCLVTQADILASSDVLIDGSDLFGEAE